MNRDRPQQGPQAESNDAEPTTNKVENVSGKRGSSLSKMLGLVDLFTTETPVWTVQEIAEATDYPASSVYRYISELVRAGFLAAIGSGKYIIGSRIIELDHQVLHSDPVHAAGRELASQLLERIEAGAVMICGLRGNRVISVFAAKKPEDLDIGVERGRPMELFRGAPAKAILAHFPRWKLTKLFLEEPSRIKETGLGSTWKEFRTSISELKRAPFVVSQGEFDNRFLALAAPIFDGDGQVVASISIVLPIARKSSTDIDSLSDPLLRVAAEINLRLSAFVNRSALATPKP